MFKVDQQVLLIRGSKEVRGVITSIDLSMMYPIHVDFEDGDYADFRLDGKLFASEHEPSLFIIDDNEDRANDLLHAALLQLEYLSEKFGETGASNALISRIKTYLNEA